MDGNSAVAATPNVPLSRIDGRDTVGGGGCDAGGGGRADVRRLERDHVDAVLPAGARHAHFLLQG